MPGSVQEYTHATAAGTTDSTMKYCDIRHLWSTVKFHHIKSFSMRSFTSDDMRSIALDSLLWASSASLCLLSSAAILSALIFRLDEVQECGLNDLIHLDSRSLLQSVSFRPPGVSSPPLGPCPAVPARLGLSGGGCPSHQHGVGGRRSMFQLQGMSAVK